MNPPRLDVADQISPGPGLSAGGRTATYALAEALFSSREGHPPPERLLWLMDDLDHFLAHAGSRARLAYGLCLLAITWLAPLLIGRPCTLASLSLPQRVEALERLEQSPFALAFFGAKTILCILYYEHPEAARAAGVDASCLRSPR
ncbi:MAG: hypothetical protein RMJ98_20670 [Myxococcales bacterium]|nr:hypothetical protein [Polyangiaceae bacterium]MDW8251717.1 hypothetical protein [Myxococcales bacterium]